MKTVTRVVWNGDTPTYLEVDPNTGFDASRNPRALKNGNAPSWMFAYPFVTGFTFPSRDGHPQ